MVSLVSSGLKKKKASNVDMKRTSVERNSHLPKDAAMVG